MRRFMCFVLSVVLINAVAVAPVSAQPIISSATTVQPIDVDRIIPVAYTSDFDAYNNVVGVLNSDGTRTAYIFTSPVTTDVIGEITGLEPMGDTANISMSSNTSAVSIEEASVFSGQPNTTGGNTLGTLYIGNIPNYDTYGYARTYVKIDLSFLTNIGISYRDVLSACLYFKTSATPTNAVIETYLVKNSWNENTITWSNRPDYYNGEMIGTMNYSSFDLNDTNPNYCVYITKAVMAWMQGLANNGILLKEKDDQTYSRFYSSEAANENNRPYLTVNYSSIPAPVGQGIVSGNSYYVVNRFSNECLTADSYDVGANVHLEKGNLQNLYQQQWKITSVSDTKFVLTPGTSANGLTFNQDSSGVLLGNNDLSTSQQWLIQRNWNGSYSICAGENMLGFIQMNSNSLLDSQEVCCAAYFCDFDDRDEWILYPVGKGTAVLFDFDTSIYNGEYLEPLDTTYGMATIKSKLLQHNYTASRYTNSNATNGFARLSNSDLFIYSGHGERSKLLFYDSNMQQSSILTIGGTTNSLALLNSNALARQRYVHLSSCLSGADLETDNMAGRLYWLGAHNVISHFHVIEGYTNDVWFGAYMADILTERTIGHAKKRADNYIYNEPELKDVYPHLPTGNINERHDLGDNKYRLCYSVSSQSTQSQYQYKDTLQLSGTISVPCGTDVMNIDTGSKVNKRFTLPCLWNQELEFDVYVDAYNGVYWYNSGTNLLHSYEPYTMNLHLGESVVNQTVALGVVNEFLLAAGYDVTGFQVETSNEFSKNYTIKFQHPTIASQYLVFNLQADTQGNVYIIDFTAYCYGEE